ncbi:MAG TPA: HAMP domain-containing sensor histidine kinase [Pyrinomonadaceae bacterium]|jgi:signal transduction histidine kinase
MNRTWFPILLVAGLLGLLVLLATLQYQWLGQISRAESERLERNLQTDTNRFAEDFNREIQNAYFNFQLPAAVWRNQNWNEFNQRYKFWREKTVYPDLIRNFYFTELGGQNLLRYNRENGAFEAAEWSDELNKLKPNFADEKNFQPINGEMPALLMPVHEEENETVKRVVIRSEIPPTAPTEPRKYGVLIIELNSEVIKKQLLPNLVTEYFSQSESANYKLAVTNQTGDAIFQTQELNASDATAKLLNLSPDNFLWFANREVLSSIQGERKSTMVFNKFESTVKKDEIENDGPGRIEVKVLNGGEQPRLRVFETNDKQQGGAWTLNVQHTSGSLEQFIKNTRRKNLAISFGILSLLAASVLFIFLSSQRARLLAQRQMDFVSSVSHEFRTPLAVIYSAGENLADGVANEREKVSRYGVLIKREGKKLSAMVEQILEFAGVSSGKRKYDFRETSVAKVIDEAINECRSLIDEKGFTVEREVSENLPTVAADEKALTQAVQNLIANALKYGNGEKWLKITAQNGGKKVKITVEDKGIGIEKREIGKVFEPFFRSKSVVDAQIHGNGLGLSLVKQIVEAHKGEVKVESEIGKGSKFTIELPQGN